ncbi:MAG TPA: phosphoribosyltransferase family protein [Thermoanaerobaculia bacterium]|nr:phosphoribosyltransferase family protein [Thermoanaerobaculia bacterium]
MSISSPIPSNPAGARLADPPRGKPAAPQPGPVEVYVPRARTVWPTSPLEAVVEALFPYPCLGCGAGGGGRRRLGLCAACHASLAPARPPWCRGCGRLLPRPWGNADRLCGACLRQPPPWDELWWLYPYEGPLRQVVAALKGGRGEFLGDELGTELTRRFGAAMAGRFTSVVPVPLHWRRLLGRGYNQAAAIAAATAVALDVPCRRLLRRSLRRPQKGLGRRDRLLHQQGAFHAPSLPAGSRLLLVDDVMTTGGTLAAATSALLAAGGGSVAVAVVARTPLDGERPV